MQNLLSERSREDDSSFAGGDRLVKYGSTGSISSIGSAVVTGNQFENQLHGSRQATYTPSSLYSQDSTTVPTMYFGKMSSTESVLIYDAIPKKSSTLKKSNSRVSSTGKLRLRVESFRNNKSSSGTQTGITSVMRQKGGGDPSEQVETTGTSPNKYTGQYKKNTAPNEPARKHKPKSTHEHTGESRSDRSASPDNSSTSGYSSPSAGLHSKESSPCGSKIPSPPHSLETNDNDQKGQPNSSSSSNSNHPEVDDSSSNNRITVIQIDAGQHKSTSSATESETSETSSESPPPSAPTQVQAPTPAPAPDHPAPPAAPSEMSGNNLVEKVDSKTFPFASQTRRELPSIATNGTLGRSPQSHQQHTVIF